MDISVVYFAFCETLFIFVELINYNMETKRTTRITKQRRDVSIQEFMRLVKNDNIRYDESIQRRQVWTKRNKTEYHKCLELGKDVGNFVMASVEGCMDYARISNSSYDYEYFKKLYDDKVKYISIDGGNRTRYLKELHGLYDWNGKVSDEVNDFFNITISVVEINYATKLDLHEIASYLNSGESWNQQEKRNAIYGVVSDFIRNWGNTYSETFKLIKGVTFPRMKDLELLSHFLLYHQSKGVSINNRTLDMLFRTPEIYNEKQFLNVLSTWSKCIHLIYGTKSEVGKSLSFNLFMYLIDMNRSYNSTLNKETINEFVDKYLELENNRITSTHSNPPSSNWTNINRNIPQYMTLKFETIYNDMLPFVSDYFYTLDSVRTFSEKDKIAKCIETNGVITRLDGSTEIITPLQSTNGKMIHANHMNIPHSKGGKTNMDNMNLMVAEDNIKLSNNY